MNRRIILLGGFLACASAFAATVLWISRDTTTYSSGFTDEAFSKVAVGMTAAEVHALLGEPIAIEPSHPGETWLYADADTGSPTAFRFQLLGDHTVLFSSAGAVERYFGPSNAVTRGMSKQEVIAQLGQPTRIDASRDTKREFYSEPGSYGRHEVRAVGFDDSGTVTAVYRYTTHE